MALEGTLKEFGIADIFQLIGQQQKEGVLELRSEDGDLDVFFHGGLIVDARPPDSDPDKRLLEHLVRTGILTPEQGSRVRDGAAQALSKIRDYLVDAGVIQNERVAEIERLFAMEEVYSLFHWPNGRFVFVPSEVRRNADSFSPVSAEHVLMDGFRMVDEWPAIKKIIPSPNVRVIKLSTPKPPPKQKKEKNVAMESDNFLDLGDIMDDEDDSGELSNEEQKALGVIVGKMTVQNVIDRSRMGSFEASKAVASLVNKGYLKLDVITAERETGDAFFGEEAKPRSPYILLAVAGVITLLLLVLRYSSMQDGLLAPWYVAREIRQVQVESGLHRIDHGVEVYRLLHGKLPQSLGTMAEVGLLPSDLVFSEQSSPYLYFPLSGDDSSDFTLELAVDSGQ